VGEGRRGEGKGMDRAPKLLLNQGPSEPCYATVYYLNEWMNDDVKIMTVQQLSCFQGCFIRKIGNSVSLFCSECNNGVTYTFFLTENMSFHKYVFNFCTYYVCDSRSTTSYGWYGCMVQYRWARSGTPSCANPNCYTIFDNLT